MADARAIAVCKGGPLDGQHVSVLLDETGSPEPLTSRAEITGVLYMPGDPVDLSTDTLARFYTVVQPKEASDEEFADTLAAHDETYFGHVAAFEYVPHTFNVGRDGLIVAGREV